MARRLGGEPLWWASRRPHNLRFIASAAESRENRRLPGTIPARCIHSWPPKRLNLAHRVASRWGFIGGRLFTHVSALFALLRNSRGGRARAIAAPLQAV